MRLISKLSIATGVIAIAMVPFAYAVEVTHFYITPDVPSGWVPSIVSQGSVTYVDDAPDPSTGLGTSSLQLTNGNAFDAKVGLGEWANGIPLSTLTQSGYWAKQGIVDDPAETANLELDIDLNGDDATDARFTYKPVLQAGGPTVEYGVWQHWDTTNGMFQADRNFTPTDTPVINAGSLYSLSQLRGWYTGAKVIAVSVSIGPNLPNSVVTIDGITLGSNLYDIEKVAPSTPDVVSVPKTVQDCKKYGWESLFDKEGNDFKNQGQCVSYIVTAKAKAK